MNVRNISKYFQWIDSALFFFGGLLAFLYGLQSQEIIGFESRFYLFALEMWRHGISAFPTTYQQPYPDYPVTPTVLIYGFALLWGSLNKLISVLPTALAAAMTLVVTYRIGALRHRTWGVAGALLLLLTLPFVQAARTLSIDLYVTLVTACCFYIIYAVEHHQMAVRRLYFLLPLLLVGFLMRGPIGLIIPAGVIVVFYFIERQFKKLWIAGIAAFILLLVGSLLLSALAYHVGGMDLFLEVLKKEAVGRISEAEAPQVYFYFVQGVFAYAITFPLMLIMLPAMMHPLKKDKMLMHLLGWILVIVLGMSLVGDKKIRYILAISPALALWCAYLVVGKNQSFYFDSLKKLMTYFFFCLPGLGVGAFAFFHTQLMPIIDHPTLLLNLLIMVQLVNGGLLFFYRSQLMALLFTAVITFLIVTIGIVEPINLKYNQTHDFVNEVEKIREKEKAPLVFYKEGSDGCAIKYLVNMANEVHPLFVNDLPAFDQLNPSAVVITSQEYYQALPEAVRQATLVLAKGKIGTDSVVVFNKTASHSLALF